MCVCGGGGGGGTVAIKLDRNLERKILFNLLSNFRTVKNKCISMFFILLQGEFHLSLSLKLTITV